VCYLTMITVVKGSNSSPNGNSVPLRSTLSMDRSLQGGPRGDIYDTGPFRCTKGKFYVNICDNNNNCGDACGHCLGGQFQNENSHTTTSCKDCANTCGSGTKFSACSTTADRTCPKCDSGKYQDSNSHSNNLCKDDCGAGSYIFQSSNLFKSGLKCFRSEHGFDFIAGPVDSTNHANVESCIVKAKESGICKDLVFYNKGSGQCFCYKTSGTDVTTDSPGCEKDPKFTAYLTILVRSTACTGCINGKYQNEISKYQCKDNCGAGSYIKSDKSACSICVQGQYQNQWGQSECKTCSACLAGQKQMSECSSTADRKCSECETGFYQDSISHTETSCKSCITTCGSGKKLVACSLTAQGSCPGCGSGQYQNSNLHTETSCKSCITTCGSGKKIVACSLTAQGSCLDCGSGQYQNSSSHSKTTCPICTKGQYSDTAGSLTCINCPIGTYLKDAGVSYHDNVDDCIKCPVFKYNPLQGRDECFPCPSSTEEGTTTCSGCDPGKWKNKNTITCETCPKGWYTPDRDFPACKRCPKGFYAKNLERHDSCSKCPRGRYGAVEGTVDENLGCIDCDAGRYSDDKGLAKESDSVMCKACIPGTYSKEKGNAKDSKCLNCGSGTWSSAAGVSSLTDCKPCGIGRFSARVGVAKIDNCTVCPLGFEQIEPGKAFCLPCTPGRFGKVNEDGIRNCSICLENTYSDEVAQKTSCKICAEGRTSTNSAVSCLLCPIGQYDDGIGCEMCPIGRYQPGMEKALCFECPHGRNSTEGSAICISCGVGRMKVGDYHNYTCNECKSGKFAQAGNICNNCTAGLYQNENGKGICHQCV
jgi:hypothetical protein